MNRVRGYYGSGKPQSVNQGETVSYELPLEV